MVKLMLLFGAGGLGTLLRYGANHWTRELVRGSLAESVHVWTIGVNVLGCFLIGLLWPLLHERMDIREEYRLAILVGLLGGFTTFSTFGFELFGLLEKGHPVRAAVYALSSVGLGLGAVWLGWTLAVRFGATPTGA